MVAAATPEELVRLGTHTGQALAPVLFGGLIGLGGAVLAGRAMTSLLYQIGPGDPLALGGAAVVLCTIGLVAAWLPARRAARLDPLRALRSD